MTKISYENLPSTVSHSTTFYQIEPRAVIEYRTAFGKMVCYASRDGDIYYPFYRMLQNIKRTLVQALLVA